MAGYQEVSVSGFEDFSRAVELHKGKTIFAYFTGSKDAEGKSWCPDCVQAEPVVREGLKHICEGCVFIYCQVGEKPYWKDPNNDFRKNLKVTAVPTLLKYGTLIFMVQMEKLKSIEAKSNLSRAKVLATTIYCLPGWFLLIVQERHVAGSWRSWTGPDKLPATPRHSGL